MGKRALDFCGALLGLLIFLPVLLVVALAVKLDSAGPVLFTQVRVGYRGRLFRLYKFRSMTTDSRTDDTIARLNDPRTTRVGRIIRLLRIDEIPQLLNVLKGDMSLVGPRPEVPTIVDRYSAEQRMVLEVRPGITGPTQLAWLDEATLLPADVNPTDYYVGNILPQKLDADIRYVKTRSFAVDISILALTPVRLVHLALRRIPWVMLAARFLVESATLAVATYVAFFARYDGAIPSFELRTLILGFPLELAAYSCALIYFKTSRSIWRYAGVQDFWQVAKASAMGGALNAAVMHIAHFTYPRSVLLLTPAFAILLLGAVRLTWRTIATALAEYTLSIERHRVVVVGAGRTGASVAREILSSPDLAYNVVGFVDDDRRLQHAMLHNLPVLGTTSELPELARKHKLTEVIIAIPHPTMSDLRRIREACSRAGLEFKTLPSLRQLMSGDGEVRYLRNVEVGELLQRQAMSPQLDRISQFLAGKRVMVTGAGGSIGSELCRQIVDLGPQSLLMVERAENPLFALCAELGSAGPHTKLTAALADIKHVLRMSELFSHFRPQVVFHTAAYKHVPMLESHPTEAVLNNVIGTARLANLANAHDVETFVFISTDKAVRPNNLMGATKRICELYLMALEHAKEASALRRVASTFRIVRFGNVLGSAGSALPLFRQQIENGGPITITDPDVSRFFMTIEEAVGLVLESATLELQGGIAVLDMGEPIKITTLADDFVTALGLPPSAVPRQFIGLRAGEKLHEALWDEVDEVLPSLHPRIAVVRPRERPLKDMDAVIGQLEQLAVEGLVGPLLAKVRDIIPSYQGCGETGQPWVLQLDTESRKPMATVNGTRVTSPDGIRMKRHA